MRLAAAFPFTIQTRADLMSERMAAALAAAGCKEAWIGRGKRQPAGIWMP